MPPGFLHQEPPSLASLSHKAIAAIARDNARGDFKYNRGHHPEPKHIAGASLDQVTHYRAEYEKGWVAAVHDWRNRLNRPVQRGEAS
jgi:hypothetical protein